MLDENLFFPEVSILYGNLCNGTERGKVGRKEEVMCSHSFDWVCFVESIPLSLSGTVNEQGYLWLQLLPWLSFLVPTFVQSFRIQYHVFSLITHKSLILRGGSTAKLSGFLRPTRSTPLALALWGFNSSCCIIYWLQFVTVCRWRCRRAMHIKWG